MRNNLEKVNINFIGGILMVDSNEFGRFYYDRETGEIYPDFSPNSPVYLPQAKALYSNIINFPDDNSLINEENYIPGKIIANKVSGRYEPGGTAGCGIAAGRGSNAGSG
jgi:hypothetical protein